MKRPRIVGVFYFAWIFSVGRRARFALFPAYSFGSTIPCWFWYLPFLSL
jgi:hypothetical protein